MSKVITSASILTVPLSLEVVCITLATAVDKFDTFVFLEKRMIIIVQQRNGVNKFKKNAIIFFRVPFLNRFF